VQLTKLDHPKPWAKFHEYTWQPKPSFLKQPYLKERGSQVAAIALIAADERRF
jgi:hypothetical protein